MDGPITACCFVPLFDGPLFDGPLVAGGDDGSVARVGGATGIGAGLRAGSPCGLIGSDGGLTVDGSSLLLFHTWVFLFLG
jgi:hypothetical protein